MEKYLIFALFIIVAAAGAADDDLVDAAKIKELTGIDYTGKMYSGYLAATQDESTQFHYYFQTSTRVDQDSAPVILWLNGGPGCSSLQGAFTEIGPFVFKTNTAEFMNNPYAWTTFAHVLYLESPAKVGYSYGDDKVDDDMVAKQNLHALLEFFTRFPELQQKDFYITGESYAGVYIPSLAYEILKHNESAGAKKISLKGIGVGNGCTDPTECSNEAGEFPMHIIEYLGKQGFLSEKQYSQFLSLMASGKCNDIQNLDQSCKDFANTLQDYLEAPKSFLLNPYNIYGMCWNYKTPAGGRKDPLLHRFRLLQEGEDDKYGSCTDDRGYYEWFRKAEWMQATHIRPESPKWDVCSEIQYTSLFKQSLGYYEYLIGKIKVMHFSGDVDSVVPITGTQFWVNKMASQQKLATVEKWRPWYVPGIRQGIDKDQNAGNVWTLEGFMLVTVRNAGHMVPTDKRQEALVMIRNFVEGKPLPYKS